MGTVKVILAGVSDYKAVGAANLPFCKNDVLLIRKTLINGLDIDPADIITLGLNDTVHYSDFLKSFTLLQPEIQEGDTLIVYFSGHGTNTNKGHFLVFSDGCLPTQYLIEAINRIGVKNKLIILDSCFSGNYTIMPGETINSEGWLEQFANSGCAVFASSSKSQESCLHPEQGVSIFTYFFCLAARNCFSIKRETVSLDRIREMVFMLLDRWNQAHPDMVQKPSCFQQKIQVYIM